jgi:MoaD family protein
MAIDVRVTANMQKHLGGERSINADGSNVRELLADIDARFPGFRDMVMTDGEIHRFVNIYLNDEDIRFLDQLDTSLKDGDVVSILPALAGGAVHRHVGTEL